MKVTIRWPWELEPLTTVPDIAVVIDVLAATTNIASFLSRGARELLLVNSDTLRDHSVRRADAVVVGESMDPDLTDIFHVSNAPTDIRAYPIEGKTVFFLSHNGTRVVEAAFAQSIPVVVTAAFANIGSVSTWLANQDVRSVVLLPSGERSLPASLPDQKSQEDWLCAQVIRQEVSGEGIELAEALQQSEQFIRRRYPWWETKETDIQEIMQADRYTVVPVCRPEPGWIRVVNVQEK